MLPFLKRENPKTILEGLDRAQEILDDRYQKKQVTLEQYQKQCAEFMQKREKYERQLAKKNR